MKQILSIICILIFLFSCHSSTQKQKTSYSDSSTHAVANNQKHEINFRNITSIRHSKNSNLPDSMHVKGTIIELTPGQCGQFCWGGSLKVKLENKISGYDNEYAYIVTACLDQDTKEGAKVDVMASKLTDQDTECYYLSTPATVDSKGFPFYKLSESETSKIH